MPAPMITKSLRNRYFLNKMGINVWAVSDKNNNANLKSSGIVMDMPNDWKDLMIFQKDHQINTNNHTDTINKFLSKDINKFNDSIDTDSNKEVQENSDIEQCLDIEIELPKIITGVLLSASSIHLEAIRYGDWLLLSDNKKMNGEQYGIWQSLQNALQKNSNTNNIAFTNLAIQYQANKMAWIDNELLWVLSGFFWHLFQDNYPKRLALLTEINGIIFNDDFVLKKQVTPTLIDMANNAQYKKRFWELLQS